MAYMENSKTKTFDEKKLRRALKAKKIEPYVITSLMYVLGILPLFLLLFILIAGLTVIVTNQTYATATLAIATIVLAIIAIISIFVQNSVEKKRNKMKYLEKVIEEVYNPLLSYFKENPDIKFDQNGILSARSDINRIIFNKGFILEPLGGRVKNFNGYFQRYKNNNKMNCSGWAFELNEDVAYWKRFGIILFNYYNEHVNQYRTYNNLEKLNLKEPDWNKVFYLDEVKDPKHMIK